MKKRVALCLAVVLILSMTGCALSEPVESTKPKHQSSGEHRAVYFNTLYEIEQFTKTGKTPEDFVKYESFSILGQFDDYLIFLDSYSYTRYHYSLIDPKQYPFALSVAHVKFYEPPMLLEKTDSMTDMATTGTKEAGAIIVGPLMYRYVEGTLRAITMEVDTVQLTIDLTSVKPKEYPVDEHGNYTTIIERMVFGDEEEALEAADEFITFFRENR